MKAEFTHIDTWVFDLDHTLYPPHMRLFDQIEERMIQYVMAALDTDRKTADELRRRYWQQYGTTLAGLMQLHNIDPEPFMIEVHDIDFTILRPDPVLRDRISQLHGRKIIYTNGSAPYAENVILARGLSGIFDAIYGIEHAAYTPKPHQEAFDRVFALDQLNGTTAAMFEDDHRNLEVPHRIGMKTIHVAPEPDQRPYIHHHTDDLSGFLAQLVN
ncbi:MAG: pyrimidine 5'-nucleotidase [Pseudomonadota bacterium]